MSRDRINDRRVQIETTNDRGNAVTTAFEKYSDGRYQRRRSRKKSIDVMAIKQALAEMGLTVSMVEIFGVLKDYQCTSGMYGQIEYDDFCVVLRNARAQHRNNPTLTAAFKSLCNDNDKGTVPVSNLLRSLEKLREFNVDVEKLETVCKGKEESDSIDFNEFAACFD